MRRLGVDMPPAFWYFAAPKPVGMRPRDLNSLSVPTVRSPPPQSRDHGAGRRRPTGERPLVQIFVRDTNVDQPLKALKKKMQREGSFREMKRHVHYEKPSEKRARQKAEAVRRARKLARKRAQREGLIAAPKKPTR